MRRCGALAAAFFLGFFCAPLWPGLMLEAAKAYPQGTGTVIGIMNIAGAVGGAGSPAMSCGDARLVAKKCGLEAFLKLSECP